MAKTAVPLTRTVARTHKNLWGSGKTVETENMLEAAPMGIVGPKTYDCTQSRATAISQAPKVRDARKQQSKRTLLQWQTS